MQDILKVLFVEPPPERRIGGIETALKGLAAALPVAGVEVTRAVTADARQIASADVVHFHGLWEPDHLHARRACARGRKPFLVSPHGMLEDWAFRHRGWKKRPYFYFAERPSIRRAGAVLATSEEEAVTLRRWFPARSVPVLPLGGEVVAVTEHGAARRKLGWADNEFVLLFLSRCHEKKGLHLLIASLPEAARESAAPVHLVIVGEGEPAYVAPLQRTTADWAGRVHATWVGACWTPTKWDYLSGADLMCLPSFSENFGLAVLESLFAGTPVLTTPGTPWGSLRESLPVRLAAPAEPALVSALRDAIAAPRATPEERTRTREMAVTRFDWRALAPRYADLYRQLTGRP
jgi:glycosyltransferase involved in cell wall biosynthesis